MVTSSTYQEINLKPSSLYLNLCYHLQKHRRKVVLASPRTNRLVYNRYILYVEVFGETGGGFFSNSKHCLPLSSTFALVFSTKRTLTFCFMIKAKISHDQSVKFFVNKLEETSNRAKLPRLGSKRKNYSFLLILLSALVANEMFFQSNPSKSWERRKRLYSSFQDARRRKEFLSL